MDWIPDRQRNPRSKGRHLKSSKYNKSESTAESPQLANAVSSSKIDGQIKTPSEVLVISEDLSRQFSARNVTKNWDKYADLPRDDEVETTVADFEQLLVAPSSCGGHFLFGSEKSWEAIDDWYNSNGHFNLNLVELEKNLATIPFYERHNYSKDIFSSDEIESMDRVARMASNTKFMANKQQQGKETTVETPEVHVDAVVIKPDENDDFELDELLKLTEVKSVSVEPQSSLPNVSSSSRSTDTSVANLQNPSPQGKHDSKEDIQKWLDDILDS